MGFSTPDEHKEEKDYKAMYEDSNKIAEGRLADLNVLIEEVEELKRVTQSETQQLMKAREKNRTLHSQIEHYGTVNSNLSAQNDRKDEEIEECLKAVL